mmetsp:Transcript_11649/g.43426  ORF Transcript_11649/g.43426 Transcript_11649/m.43426 type:complete len:141 (-) Transcript_11649:625-1047(-)
MMDDSTMLFLASVSGVVLLWLHRQRRESSPLDSAMLAMAGPQAPLLRRVLQLYEETKAEQFPSVKDMAIGEILRRLRSGDGSLVMVDWRTPGEVLPSLLPGAVLKRDFLRVGLPLSAFYSLHLLLCLVRTLRVDSALIGS